MRCACSTRALLGVGGGVFMVPVMVLMFHWPMSGGKQRLGNRDVECRRVVVRRAANHQPEAGHDSGDCDDHWHRSGHSYLAVLASGLLGVGGGVLKEFDAFTLMMIATALLIPTPVLRVVNSIWAFWVDRDHKYVVVTSIVLAVIGLSVVLADFGVK